MKENEKKKKKLVKKDEDKRVSLPNHSSYKEIFKAGVVGKGGGDTLCVSTPSKSSRGGIGYLFFAVLLETQLKMKVIFAKGKRGGKKKGNSGRRG